MLPPQLAQMLQGGPPPEEGPDHLGSLQEVLNLMPGVISSLPDPQDTQDAIAALQTLARIQTRLMKASPGAPQPPQ